MLSRGEIHAFAFLALVGTVAVSCVVAGALAWMLRSCA